MDRITKQQEECDCRYRTNSEMREAIITKRLDGQSQASIAQEFSLHQSTISRIMAGYFKSQEEGNDNE